MCAECKHLSPIYTHIVLTESTLVVDRMGYKSQLVFAPCKSPVATFFVLTESALIADRMSY